MAFVCITFSPFSVSTNVRFPDSLRNHVHCGFEIQFLPLGRVWPAILDARFAAGMGEQFETVRTFRAQTSARNWRVRVAFNRNQLPVFVINQLAAAYGTIGTYRARSLSPMVLRNKIAGAIAHGLNTGPVAVRQDLPHDRPPSHKILDLHSSSNIFPTTACVECNRTANVMLSHRTTDSRPLRSRRGHHTLQRGRVKESVLAGQKLLCHLIGAYRE